MSVSEGSFFFQLAHAGSGGGGDHDPAVPELLLSALDESQGKVYFTHADRVQPNAFTLIATCNEIGVVSAKTLSDPVPPLATTRHASKIIGGGDQQPQVEKAAIDPLKQS